MSSLVEIEASEWDNLLARLGCADAYYLSDYVESARVLEPGRPAFLHLEGDGGDVVFACLVREAPGGACDVVTPYGYGGPVATGPEPPVERFWDLYQRWCERGGILTSFIRFHPLFGNHRYAGPDLVVERYADTTGWRLDLADLFTSMHPAHRRACRKAERAGVLVSVTESPDDLSAFTALYEPTMRRAGASDFYFFPAPYWSAVLDLRDRLVLVNAEIDGEPVATALCLATQPWLHYHLGGTSELGRTLRASNLLFYRAAEWGRAQGYERFHLGGGAGGHDDSLAAFKRRFDPGGQLEWWLGKAVHDPATYRELTGRDPADRSGFFPAYRAG